MTVKGCIEARFKSHTYARYVNHEMFICIVKFLETCSSLGITRIASNGINRAAWWNDNVYIPGSESPSTTAWCVYRFANADVPFNLYLHVVNSSVYGTSISNTVLSSGEVGQTVADTALGIAVGQNIGGANAWNGGTANAGADAKSATVWNTNLLVYPRINSSPFGAQLTNRQAVVPITSGIANGTTGGTLDAAQQGARMHCLVDENNFLLLIDTMPDNSIGNSAAFGLYSMFYFGRYRPLAGLPTPQAPYVMLFMNRQSYPNWFPRRIWGSRLQRLIVDVSEYADGGIAHPTAANGVKIAFTDYNTAVTNPLTTPNSAIYPRARYDLFPCFVGIAEQDSPGLLGTIDFFRLTNAPQFWTSPDKRIAVFGANRDSDTNINVNIAIPWDGVTTPGSGNSRSGIIF